MAVNASRRAIGQRAPLVAAMSSYPSILFASGAPGVFFDRSDLSTMFQDSGGTTACALGSPVGLALDKSKGAARGADVIVGGDFADPSKWTISAAWAVSGGVATNPGGAGQISQAVNPLTVGQWYEATWDNLGAANTINVVFGNNFVSCAQVAGRNRAVGQCTTSTVFGLQGGGPYSVDNVTCRPIPGNHATQGTAASRPILRQDASGRYYLEYDGVDDGMATAAIDFTGTDKMTVLAGLHKLSDASFSIFCELSANADLNSGSCYIAAPLGAATPTIAGALKGSGTIQGISSGAIHAAPVSVVVTHQSDIAAPLQTLRTNGVQRATNAASPGAGSFGNYPLYMGRRGGASAPFNGRDYGLIVVGRALSATEIARAERFLAGRMGVTL